MNEEETDLQHNEILLEIQVLGLLNKTFYNVDIFTLSTLYLPIGLETRKSNLIICGLPVEQWV